MDSRRFLLTTFLLCLVYLASGPSKADEQHSLEKNLSNEKTLMLADSVDFDQHKDIVRARGHVQVARDKMTLYADEITYDRKADLIVAQGNVRLVDADNNMSFAHRIELSGDFKEGVAHAIRGIMADDALFAANSIKRTNGTRNQFNQVAYTPCEVCRSDPHKSPTWQIKSRHMIWDEVSGDITHADARLEIGDIPVIYTPYLSHPGPTVKRRSGFLSAILGGGGGLGAIVGVPYFWAIDKDKDLTVTPFYTKENPLLWWVYRQSFCQGFFKFESSVTHSKYKRGPTNREKVENRLRGHVKTSAQVNITRNWRAGFNIHRTLDDTYLKKYRFLGQTRDHFLTSDLYAESFWKRNYARIEAISFQSLTQNDSASHPPTPLDIQKACIKKVSTIEPMRF